MGKMCTFLSKESAGLDLREMQLKGIRKGIVCVCARDMEMERDGEVGWCFLLHFLCVMLLC